MTKAHFPQHIRHKPTNFFFYTNYIQMDLAKRDITIREMQREVADKKRELLSKFKELERATSENELLEGVVDDYATYYDYVREQKSEEYEALRIISEYLDRLSLDVDVTDQLLRQTKEDQKEILREMSKIKREMDQLVRR